MNCERSENSWIMLLNLSILVSSSGTPFLSIAKIQKLRTQIIEIKESETFKEVKNISDWDIYFEENKQKLLSEKEKLGVGL